jgi:putative endonuclease
MSKEHRYFVYILTNKSRILYIGVTGDLVQRLYQHRNKLVDGFTKKYNITELVHFEETSNVVDAIAREKQLKGWVRAKKVALIEAANPEWRDLGSELSGPDPSLRSG